MYFTRIDVIIIYVVLLLLFKNVLIQEFKIYKAMLLYNTFRKRY